MILSVNINRKKIMINAIVEAQIITTFILVAAAFAALVLNKKGS